MMLREYLNHNPVVATVAVIFALLLALGVLTLILRGPAEGVTPTVYYVDLETGDVFAGASTSPPPESPAGHEAAQAYMFSCNGCDDDQQRFLGYAVKAPPPRGIPGEAAVSQDLRRWFAWDDERAAAIQTVRCPDGSRPQRCGPE